MGEIFGEEAYVRISTKINQNAADLEIHYE